MTRLFLLLLRWYSSSMHGCYCGLEYQLRYSKVSDLMQRWCWYDFVWCWGCSTISEHFQKSLEHLLPFQVLVQGLPMPLKIAFFISIFPEKKCFRIMLFIGYSNHLYASALPYELFYCHIYILKYSFGYKTHTAVQCNAHMCLYMYAYKIHS